MKSEIHPQYHDQATITCACGQVFKAGSTKKEMSVETCSNCHPFYTGRQKLVDTGRVKRFEDILKASADIKKQVKKPTTKPKTKSAKSKAK